jgi:hypothetical protein
MPLPGRDDGIGRMVGAPAARRCLRAQGSRRQERARGARACGGRSLRVDGAPPREGGVRGAHRTGPRARAARKARRGRHGRAAHEPPRSRGHRPGGARGSDADGHAARSGAGARRCAAGVLRRSGEAPAARALDGGRHRDPAELAQHRAGLFALFPGSSASRHRSLPVVARGGRGHRARSSRAPRPARAHSLRVAGGGRHLRSEVRVRRAGRGVRPALRGDRHGERRRTRFGERRRRGSHRDDFPRTSRPAQTCCCTPCSPSQTNRSRRGCRC